MEKIGTQKIWSYFDGVATARPAANQKIRGSEGHRVPTYFQLAKKVLSFNSSIAITCFFFADSAKITVP
jgi:hypothetical protein